MSTIYLPDTEFEICVYCQKLQPIRIEKKSFTRSVDTRKKVYTYCMICNKLLHWEFEKQKR